MIRAALLAACLTASAACLASAAAPRAYRWSLPAGVAPPPVPADNPISAAKVELGRRLFYEADLSIDGTMSCATCHEQHRAFADGNRTHPGVHGDPGRRNVMALANVSYFASLTWGDPGHRRLESQALVPLEGLTPVEMGMAGQSKALVDRLGSDACYRKMFADAFPADGGKISFATVAKALATFQRTLVSATSPYDRSRRGDRTALSLAARRGEALFMSEKAGCARCHSGPDFTDAASVKNPKDAFHAIGPVDAADRGLGEITGDPKDDGRFRTPSLRNIALTAPYLHDGSAATLGEAIRRHKGVELDEGAMTDMIAFLGALTDRTFVTDPRFALPRTHCGRPA